jgi:DNA repair protein RecO
MRHKYSTRAIVLGRIPVGEESISATLLTESFGIVRARSQGARKKGSKMSAGLQTLSSSDVTLLRGKDGWRMAGAVIDTNWARELEKPARRRAARVLDLADRLVRGEHADPELYLVLSAFLVSLHEKQEEEQDILEVLAVVRLLHILGLDAGEVYGAMDDFSSEVIEQAREHRSSLITRSNRGITASGL